MREPYQTVCPECREEGRDRTGDNLCVFPEGNTYCNACGYKGFVDAIGVSMPRESKLEYLDKHSTDWGVKVGELKDYPLGNETSRKVGPVVLKSYGVRHSVNVETGEISSVFYPHYEGEEIVGYKERKLGTKDFVCKGDRSTLFGRNPSTKGMGRLLITEGEEDCLAAKQMLTVGCVPQECDVVSLPNGAAVDKVTKAQLDFFKGYKRVYICLDNDEVGKKAAKEMASWLAASTEPRIVELPTKYGKDASDYLTDGSEAEFRAAVGKAKAYLPDGIVNGNTINIEDLLKPREEGYPYPFTGVNNYLHGLRKAEVVLVTADSGVGKTTFVREINKGLIEQGHGVANIALEDQMEVTMQSLIALDMNIPLSEFMFHPPTKSEIQPSFDKLIAPGNAFFYAHKGNVDSKILLDTLTAYSRSAQVDFIILDHIGVALAGTENSRISEAKQIDILMNKLANLVKETGVGIIVVAHLKRATDGQVYEHGREVKLTDLRGSAALEQVAFAVIALEREQQAEEEEDNNKVRARVLKNRVFSRTGVADHLLYIPETGRMVNRPIPIPVELEGVLE